MKNENEDLAIAHFREYVQSMLPNLHVMTTSGADHVIKLQCILRLIEKLEGLTKHEGARDET